VAGALQANFEKVFAELYDKVYDLAYRLTGAPHDAEDVVQEAFMRIHRALPGFRGESKLSSWAYRITVNAFHDSKRTRSSEEMPIEAEKMESSGQGELSSAQGSIDDQVIAKMEDEEIRRALKRLAETDRVVFTLSALERLSHAEIAEITGKTPAAVKTALSRARKKIIEIFRLADNGCPEGRR
jgi:RNA polymerase sigma-70 factor, ECF subfamily